jgi:hypothetical protein
LSSFRTKKEIVILPRSGRTCCLLELPQLPNLPLPYNLVILRRRGQQVTPEALHKQGICFAFSCHPSAKREDRAVCPTAIIITSAITFETLSSFAKRRTSL